MKYLSIILLFVACPFLIRAAHLKGGYIEYENLGPTPGMAGYTSYNIFVYQYLDCNSAGGQIDPDVFLGVFDGATNVQYTMIIMPTTGFKINRKESFHCIDNPPQVCYRIDKYFAKVDLKNNPAGYILSVQRCCRIAGINNVIGSSNTGVTYTVKLYPDLAGNGFIRNSSPIFSQEDTSLVCAQNGFSLPFKATDPDGDSLVYHFTAGLNTPSREAKPQPPYPPPFPELDYANDFTSVQPLGPTVKIDPNTGIISGIAPPAAGDYVVAVSVDEYRVGVKIGETRKELHVAVGNCNIPQAVLPENMINCDDFTMLFENQSTASGIDGYFWDFGVKNSKADTSNAPTPSFTYPDTGVYKVKLVVNPHGVCPDSMEADVRIFPGFKVDFEVKGACYQLPYQFIDISKTKYGVVNKWRWNFGDGSTDTDSSTLKNPSYKYENPANYNTTLVASTSKGCVDTLTKTVKVSDKPDLQLAFRDTLICSADSVQLKASAPGTYSWSPAVNIINPNSASPVVFPKNDITYFVVLNNQNCIANDSVKVRVVNFITVNAGNDSTICRGDAISLHAVSQASRFTWAPATGLNNALLQEPIATVTNTAITYHVNASLGTCKATDSLTIITEPYPELSAGNDTTICFGHSAMLRGTSNADILRWEPATFVANKTSAVTTATPSTSQLFVLTGNFATGCTKEVSDTVLVNVLDRITVFAGNDTSLVVGESLTMNAQTNVTNFLWTPSIGLSNVHILKPELLITTDLFSSTQQYLRYTLTASSNEGCNASDDIIIRLFDKPSIFVPSGFTPNGDGLNDVMRPVLAGIKQFDYFRVYNRYGQLIYETSTPGAGWNGTINGQPQSTGAYVYDCRAVDYKGKKTIAKGNFVLIR